MNPERERVKTLKEHEEEEKELQKETELWDMATNEDIAKADLELEKK